MRKTSNILRSSYRIYRETNKINHLCASKLATFIEKKRVIKVTDRIFNTTNLYSIVEFYKCNGFDEIQ